MKATKDGQYRKTGTGNLVFRYKVSGTKEELEAYKKAQGDNYRESEDGTPLFFSTRNIGNVCPLGITQKGSVFADTSEMDSAASLAAQYGGNLGQAIANAYAEKMVNGIRGGASTVSAPVQENADLNK